MVWRSKEISGYAEKFRGLRPRAPLLSVPVMNPRLAMRTDEIRAFDRRGSVGVRLHDNGQQTRWPTCRTGWADCRLMLHPDQGRPPMTLGRRSGRRKPRGPRAKLPHSKPDTLKRRRARNVPSRRRLYQTELVKFPARWRCSNGHADPSARWRLSRLRLRHFGLRQGHAQRSTSGPDTVRNEPGCLSQS